MISILLEIWSFLKSIAELFYTVYTFIHSGILFAFRLVVAGVKLVTGVFAGGLAFLFPLALLSLFVGFVLLFTGQR